MNGFSFVRDWQALRVAGVLLLLLLAGSCSDSPVNLFRKQDEK
jgi:hypothetical protein